MALVTKILNTFREYQDDKWQTEPSLIAFYDIRPGNGWGLSLGACSPHRPCVTNNETEGIGLMLILCKADIF